MSAAVLINASLLSYVIPASLLIFPFQRLMHTYGLSNDPWAVIAAQVTFAFLVPASPGWMLDVGCSAFFPQ